jgi:hypothetical protein
MPKLKGWKNAPKGCWLSHMVPVWYHKSSWVQRSRVSNPQLKAPTLSSGLTWGSTNSLVNQFYYCVSKRKQNKILEVLMGPTSTHTWLFFMEYYVSWNAIKFITLSVLHLSDLSSQTIYHVPGWVVNSFPRFHVTRIIWKQKTHRHSTVWPAARPQPYKSAANESSVIVSWAPGSST